MRCDNCRSESDPAFTLAAHPAGDDAVLVDFCGIECLQAWTSRDGATVEGRDWAATGGERDTEPAAPASR